MYCFYRPGTLLGSYDHARDPGLVKQVFIYMRATADYWRCILSPGSI